VGIDTILIQPGPSGFSLSFREVRHQKQNCSSFSHSCTTPKASHSQIDTLLIFYQYPAAALPSLSLMQVAADILPPTRNLPQQAPTSMQLSDPCFSLPNLSKELILNRLVHWNGPAGACSYAPPTSGHVDWA
jgi:hypothetical protein